MKRYSRVLTLIRCSLLAFTRIHTRKTHTRGLFYQFLPFRYANRLQTSTFNSMAVCVYLMQAAFTTCKGIRCFPFLSFFLVLCFTRGNANARGKRSLNLRNFFFFSLHCFSFLCFPFKLRLIILVEHSGTLII